MDTSPPPAPPTLTRSERLDRLPFTGLHRRLVAGSGAGWALDAMDVGLISSVMTALAVQWDLGPTTLSWVASVSFIGMAVGASVGGLMADRVGRRQVFALTLLVYGVATGAAALSWSVGALLVFRFLIGLGLGAEPRWPRRWSASSRPPGSAVAWSSYSSRSGPSAGSWRR